MIDRSKTERYMSFVIEYGVYLYILFLFSGKGEGLRNIGLYGAFVTWIVYAIYSKKIRISFNILGASVFIFIASALLSSLFSLDPLYSFTALKKDLLRGVITFLIISTFFSTKMLIRAVNILCFTGLVVFALGLYSYLAGSTDFFTSENAFLSIHYNLFGFILAFITPFYLFNMLSKKIRWKKIVWGLFLAIGFVGVVLSSSRGAIGNAVVALSVFTVFLINRENFKKISVLVVVGLMLASATFKLWPEPVKKQIIALPKQLSTFNLRTGRFWIPAIKSVKNRPVLGWGYGSKIYRDARPFENTQKPRWRKEGGLPHKGGLHSSFVTILFHQGIIGLFSYLFLLGSSSYVLFGIIKEKADERRLLALTLLSVIIGSFIFNAFVLSVPFRRLALIVAMSAALINNTLDVENRNQ
jgi:O-antigen ligase